MPLSIVILAAGKGTRMCSSKPKVLHELGGKALLKHVIDTARQLEPSQLLVVVGHGREQIADSLASEQVTWIEQREQHGTGHALQQAMPAIPADHDVLVLYGDVPLTRLATLQPVVASLESHSLCLLTATLDEPGGYGRILRGPDSELQGIVEHKDAGAAQRSINEINSGIVAVKADALQKLLAMLDCKNSQGEFYLTDIVGLAHEAGLPMTTCQAEDINEISGVNDRVQLARLERVYQQSLAEQLMLQGVTLRDPARIDIRGTLQVGADSEIDIDCVFIGDNTVGEGVRIGPHCTLIDSKVENGSLIEANSMIEQSTVGEQCSVGPFARLRPNTVMARKARLGNFVEIKNSTIGEGSKVNHLSYVGDSDVAESVNIGAGVITANYDGANKHRTRIEAKAFIGSNSVLVAPIAVGKGSTVGAGSTLTKDVGDGELALARGRAKTIANWQRPQKQK